MTAFGKIESFDATKENWETYVERVEQFFLANDIDDGHKVPTLLSLIGGKAYTLLRDGSSYTGEASYKVLSTDSYHSPGAFEPEALGDFVSTRETNTKEKAFFPTWPG